MLVLRLTHILAGVFWVGATLMMNFYVGPTIGATGEAGQQVTRYLMAKTRLAGVISLQKTLALLIKLNTWSLIIAVLFMAVARYLVF